MLRKGTRLYKPNKLRIPSCPPVSLVCLVYKQLNALPALSELFFSPWG